VGTGRSSARIAAAHQGQHQQRDAAYHAGTPSLIGNRPRANAHVSMPCFAPAHSLRQGQHARAAFASPATMAHSAGAQSVRPVQDPGGSSGGNAAGVAARFRRRHRLRHRRIHAHPAALAASSLPAYHRALCGTGTLAGVRKSFPSRTRATLRDRSRGPSPMSRCSMP